MKICNITKILFFTLVLSFFCPSPSLAVDAPNLLPIHPNLVTEKSICGVNSAHNICFDTFGEGPKWYTEENHTNPQECPDRMGGWKYVWQASMLTNASSEEILSWYKEKLTADGWQEDKVDRITFECEDCQSQKRGEFAVTIIAYFVKYDAKSKLIATGTVDINDGRVCNKYLSCQLSKCPAGEEMMRVDLLGSTNDPWFRQALIKPKLLVNSNVENVQVEIKGEYFSGKCATGKDKQCSLEAIKEFPMGTPISVSVSGYKEGYYNYVQKFQADWKNGNYSISIYLKPKTSKSLLHFVTNIPGAVFSFQDQTCVADNNGDCLIYIPIKEENGTKTITHAAWKGEAAGYIGIEGNNYLVAGDERWIWAPFRNQIETIEPATPSPVAITPSPLPSALPQPSQSIGTGFPIPVDICLEGTELCAIQNRIWQKYHFVLHDAYLDDMHRFEALLDRLPEAFTNNLFLTEVFIDYQDLTRSIMNMAAGNHIAGYYDSSDKYLRPIHILEDLSMNLGMAGTTESNFMHELIHAYQFGFQNNFPWEESFNQDWITSEPLKSWIELTGWKLVEGNWINETDQEEMVNWYAKTKPYEDMAESARYYVYHNKELKNESPKRWDFIKNNIFEGWEP